MGHCRSTCLDDSQPSALQASARHVSIATEISRLVSSSVERWRLKWAMLLHPIVERRKLSAFDHVMSDPGADRDPRSFATAPALHLVVLPRRNHERAASDVPDMMTRFFFAIFIRHETCFLHARAFIAEAPDRGMFLDDAS
jgi:hypothetical protein